MDLERRGKREREEGTYPCNAASLDSEGVRPRAEMVLVGVAGMLPLTETEPEPEPVTDDCETRLRMDETGVSVTSGSRAVVAGSASYTKSLGWEWNE